MSNHQCYNEEIDKRNNMNNETCCCICLEEFSDGDEVCQSFNCDHIFHIRGCMSEWLLSHDECPICRRDYIPTCSKRGMCRRQHPIDPIPYVGPVVLVRSSSSLDLNNQLGALTGNVDVNLDGNLTGNLHGRRDGRDIRALFSIDDIPPWLVITGTV
jgi:hypothetical protein